MDEVIRRGATAALVEAVALFERDARGALGEAEDCTWLSYSRQVAADELPDCGELASKLQPLPEAFGDSLIFQLRHDETEDFGLAAGFTPAALEYLYDKQKTVPVFELFVKVTKAELLKHWNIGDDNCAWRLFLFEKALDGALRAPLVDLKEEEGLLGGVAGKAKAIILLPDRDIELTGPRLAILGGKALERWRDHAAATLPPDEIVENAHKLLRWVYFDLEPLTPLHLELHPADPPPNDAIAAALCAQWTTCCILYLAEHSRWDKDAKSWQVTFPAEKFSVAATVGGVDSVIAALGPSPWTRARALGNRTRWVYEGEKQVRDRLSVVQNVIANLLEETDPAATGQELIRKAEDIERRAEGGWKAFIAQKLDKYFGQVKQLEDTIDATIRTYDEQIQTLTKSLTDNMLAAVAVVAGSFIAAMFKSPFQPYVFWVGAGLYLAYLVIFPVIVGLTATKRRFEASKAAFQKRIDDFAGRLTRDDVTGTVGQTVQDREKAFLFWFNWTRRLYGLVIVVLFVALFLVPRFVQSWNDDFELTAIRYGNRTDGSVTLRIEGVNFDRNKEIAVFAGNATYSNSARTVSVFGSRLLTIVVPERELPRPGTLLRVVQGNDEEALPLPAR